MFKVSHEFTFSLNTDGKLNKFIGQLVFEGVELNEFGTLHTDDEITRFGKEINSAVELPEFWTVEILTRTLFFKFKPMFTNLKNINLFAEAIPQRVVEYGEEYMYSIHIGDQ